MRDRLIELLCSAPLGSKTFEQQYYKSTITKIADYLLANGVVVLPCKVGDAVYYPWIYQGQSGIAFNEVESIKIYFNRLPIVIVENWESDMPMPISFTIEDFGKTVFLTREEAERALKPKGTAVSLIDGHIDPCCLKVVTRDALHYL